LKGLVTGLSMANEDVNPLAYGFQSARSGTMTQLNRRSATPDPPGVADNPGKVPPPVA